MEVTAAFHNLTEERGSVSYSSLFTHQDILKLKLIFNLNTEAIYELKLNCVGYLEAVLPYSS